MAAPGPSHSRRQLRRLPEFARQRLPHRQFLPIHPGGLGYVPGNAAPRKGHLVTAGRAR